MTRKLPFIFFCALFLLLSESLFGQVELNLGGNNSDDEIGETMIKFEQDEYDLGKIHAGDTVEVKIRFKNVGKEELIIETVKPSCACTTLEWPERPVDPGEEGVIYAQISTEDKTGEQVKSFMVMYNGNPPMEKVKLIFFVEGDEEKEKAPKNE